MGFVTVVKHLRDGVVALLEDPVVGWNTTFETACDQYGVTPFTIDFTGGTNFFQGRLAESDLEQSTYLKDQFAILYTTETRDGVKTVPRVVSTTFGGTVSLALDIYVAYREEYTPAHLENMADAITDATYSVFSGANVAFWPTNCIRQWQMNSTRKQIIMASSNWLQCISFGIPWEVLA